jgi:hypothetical protein
MPTIRDVMNRNKQLYGMMLAHRIEVEILANKIDDSKKVSADLIARIEKLEGSMKRVPVVEVKDMGLTDSCSGKVYAKKLYDAKTVAAALTAAKEAKKPVKRKYVRKKK